MEEPSTDFMIRIRKDSQSNYPVEAWLSDGSFYEGTADLTSALLQQLLESDYDPVRYGRQLSKTLFAGRIATAYDVATGLAQQQSRGRLRIRLWLDESLPAELHALKWERMANLLGIPLAISSLTPFSRYTALPRPEPGPLDEPVVRLLFVVSAPSNLDRWDLAPIDVEKEVRRLLEALENVTRDKRCQATILPGQTRLSSGLREDLKEARWEVADGAATLDNIGERLRGQHVFHFLGHGQYRPGQGSLLLEKEDGILEPVVDSALAARLTNTPVRLVFLAACESARSDGAPANGAAQGGSFEGLAAKLVQCGIPAVVAMQEQLRIDAAYRLTGEFYRRLFLEHGVVDRALNEARGMLYDQEELDWGTPMLTMRLKTGQLATANPVWAALQEIREHSDYELFRTGQYIPLGLQAMPVNEGQDPSQYEQPEPQRIGTLDLIEAILSHLTAADRASAAPVVLVLGGPSTSKSTQMKLLGWKTVQAGLQEQAKEGFLPLYLGLQDYHPVGSADTEALEGQILDKLRLFLPDLAARSLDKLSKQMPQVRLRLLFSAGDTLPEVGRDLVKLTVALARGHPQHQYVLAVPPSALHWDNITEIDEAQRCVLAIQPLTQRGIRHSLEVQGEAGARLLDALYNSSLFDLASAPYFFVNMMGRAKKGQDPTSHAVVLQQLIDEAIAQVPAGEGMRTNTPQTLYEMAREMQDSGVTVWPRAEAFRVMNQVRGERGYSAEELYACLVQQELLVPVGKDSVRFAYSSIQAYCCAKAILALPEPEKTLCEIVDALGSPVRMRWWEETLVVTSGLLAAESRWRVPQTLLCLLERIIHGADLLEGTRVFLGARCLLECKSVFDAQTDPKAKEELHKLVDHVVNALLWRSDSATEPDLAQRLQATQLLAQLGLPEVAVGLASKAYSVVRKNVVEKWDYEFSSVRFAAAIALKRMTPDVAAEALTEINPKLVELFGAWQCKDVEALIRHSQDAGDPGLRGLAALALGDLHGPLGSTNRTKDAECALERLQEMFKVETCPSVCWPVADALSLVDRLRVIQSIVKPLLEDTRLGESASFRSSLAYLIGLLRLRDEKARNFLLRDCMGLEGEEGPREWKIWATAITALGRIASGSDAKLLAEIAAGRAEGRELDEFFPEETERNYVRREAINALANQGDLEVLCPEDRDRLAKEPALFKAYYKAIQEIYWRGEATACAAREGTR